MTLRGGAPARKTLARAVFWEHHISRNIPKGAETMAEQRKEIASRLKELREIEGISAEKMAAAATVLLSGGGVTAVVVVVEESAGRGEGFLATTPCCWCC